jgi:hypothetical protein
MSQISSNSFRLEHLSLPRWTVTRGPTAAGQPEHRERFLGRIPARLAAFSRFSPSLEHLHIVPPGVDANAVASLGRLSGLKTLRVSLLQ